MNEKTYYKNECPFPGSRELVPFQHFGAKSQIPLKCSTCRFEEEGRCVLLTNPLKRLDYDFCGIEGDTCLAHIPETKQPLPAKCVNCRYLYKHPKFSRLIWCEKDKPEWAQIGRGLDYGDRELAPLKSGQKHDRDVRTP